MSQVYRSPERLPFEETTLLGAQGRQWTPTRIMRVEKDMQAIDVALAQRMQRSREVFGIARLKIDEKSADSSSL